MDEENFVFRGSSLSNLPAVPVGRQLVDRITDSKKRILAAIQLDEIYSVVIEDYLEFEQSVLSAALSHSVNPLFRREDHNSMRRLFNRRLMHLLTAARSYIDSATKLIPTISGTASQDILQRFRQSRIAAYDSLIGYRFMEELRNSAQHFGFPIHGFTIGSKWDSGKDGRKEKVRYLAIPQISIRALSQDKKFKKKILDELKGDQIDVRPHLREYVHGISRIQNDLYEATKPFLVDADNSIRHGFSILDNGSSEAYPWLVIERRNPDGSLERVEEISHEIIEELGALELRTWRLPRLNLTYVSSDSSLDKE